MDGVVERPLLVGGGRGVGEGDVEFDGLVHVQRQLRLAEVRRRPVGNLTPDIVVFVVVVPVAEEGDEREMGTSTKVATDVIQDQDLLSFVGN